MYLSKPRYRKRLSVHVISQNVDGLITDIYPSKYGWCYSILVRNTNITIQVLESDILREGDQEYESKRFKSN
jgi:hypothetical protein